MQSVLCTRPLVVLIKDLIADNDCVNWKNSDDKTAYDLLKENNGLIASSDKEKTLSWVHDRAILRPFIHFRPCIQIVYLMMTTVYFQW